MSDQESGKPAKVSLGPRAVPTTGKEIMRMNRTSTLLWAGLVLGLAAGTLAAQGSKPFRIGTGAETGTYAPIGAILARSLSDASGPALTAVPSQGSVANVQAIAAGQIQSGLSQSDIVYWAFTATGAFEGKPPLDELRAIANLYQESIHLVVRKAAGIQSVSDLRGKRVSLDEQGSGTLPEALLLLDAWGLKETDLNAEHLNLDAAAREMKQGTLDAFFYVGGYPVPAIVELANAGAEIDLPPLDGPKAEKLRGDYKFLARDEIPGNTYKGIDATKTLSVGALWVTSAKVDAAVVYEVTKALWSDKAREALAAGHPKGKLIRKDTALNGIGIPLHPGAERFYREAGFLQ